MESESSRLRLSPKYSQMKVISGQGIVYSLTLVLHASQKRRERRKAALTAHDDDQRRSKQVLVRQVKRLQGDTGRAESNDEAARTVVSSDDGLPTTTVKVNDICHGSKLI
ncbi:hypothetical protein DVH05_022565 [Phytophthora capsici]|nr:hypothetical protein DVH05_022565 [Phytophthora capsici]